MFSEGSIDSSEHVMSVEEVEQYLGAYSSGMVVQGIKFYYQILKIKMSFTNYLYATHLGLEQHHHYKNSNILNLKHTLFKQGYKALAPSVARVHKG